VEGDQIIANRFDARLTAIRAFDVGTAAVAVFGIPIWVGNAGLRIGVLDLTGLDAHRRIAISVSEIIRRRGWLAIKL
jgi:hypothetical protein